MIVLILLVSMLFSGCGNSVSASVLEGTAIVEENTEDTISLSCVKAPKFEEDFATLYSGTTALVVYWGVGDRSFMWPESGYPGFDYPMIVETDVDLDERARVYLQTQWGQYEYKCTASGMAMKDADNLTDLNTEKQLVNWGKRNEILILWNSVTGRYTRYDLCGGTKIEL